MNLFKRMDHIGYAVEDIEITAAPYINAGWTLSPIYEETGQRSRIAFLTRDDMTTIELVSPLEGPSPVDRFLQNGGVQPYHVCYEVSDIIQAIESMHQQDFMPLFMPVESIAMGGRLICYLYNKNAGLVEIVENKY